MLRLLPGTFCPLAQLLLPRTISLGLQIISQKQKAIAKGWKLPGTVLILSPGHSYLPTKLLFVFHSLICVNTPICLHMEIWPLAGSVGPFLPVVFLSEAVVGFENTLQLGEFLLLINLAFPSRLLLSEKMIVLIGMT